jgi:hypothetical protein
MSEGAAQKFDVIALLDRLDKTCVPSADPWAMIIPSEKWLLISKALRAASAWYAACHEPDHRKCDEAREAFGRALEGSPE